MTDDTPAPLAHTPRRARWPHAMARAFAVGFLGFSMLYGLVEGGHLDTRDGPVRSFSDRAASYIGYAASQVRITGLERHDPQTVLAAIGVRLGGSLLGFDAANARKQLENMGWVETAMVHRIYPNQLDIVITERQPFAVWQRDGSYFVIDRSGSPIEALAEGQAPGLLLVTGEGAQTAASDLVNRLEAHPDLGSKVRAASRVGDRRWTLHLQNGQRIALPEDGVDEALALAEELDRQYGLFEKSVADVDLRLKDRVTFVPMVKDAAESQEPVKVSRR
ncbi:MAG: FtsQ-type POTRA domain-containing protein [Hyphomicrobiales bacterium]